MKKVKGLFVLPLVCFIVGLTGCLEDVGNSESMTSFAVAGWSPTNGGTYISTFYGEYAAPALTGKVNEGACMVASFTVDYDNQPSTTYVTATDVLYEEIPQSYAQYASGDMIDEYNDSIVNLSSSSSPFYKGKLFLSLQQKAAKDQKFTYELLCHPDSADNKGVPTFFLKPKKNGAGTGSLSDNYTYCAVDVNNFISQMGQDTTISNVKLKFIQFNLKYQTGMKSGAPVYTKYTDPVFVAVIK